MNVEPVYFFIHPAAIVYQCQLASAVRPDATAVMARHLGISEVQVRSLAVLTVDHIMGKPNGYTAEGLAVAFSLDNFSQSFPTGSGDKGFQGLLDALKEVVRTSDSAAPSDLSDALSPGLNLAVALAMSLSTNPNQLDGYISVELKAAGFVDANEITGPEYVAALSRVAGEIKRISQIPRERLSASRALVVDGHTISDELAFLVGYRQQLQTPTLPEIGPEGPSEAARTERLRAVLGGIAARDGNPTEDLVMNLFGAGARVAQMQQAIQLRS